VGSLHCTGWHCRRRPWPNLSNYPGICPKVLWKTIKILTRTISIPAENRPEHFPNTRQKRCAVAFESDSSTPDSTSDIANNLAAWCNGALGLRGGRGTSAGCMCRHVPSWPREIALSGRAIHHARTGDNSAAAEQIRTCTSVVQISVRKMQLPNPSTRRWIKISTALDKSYCQFQETFTVNFRRSTFRIWVRKTVTLNETCLITASKNLGQYLTAYPS
jgi:hypothetical protein